MRTVQKRRDPSFEAIRVFSMCTVVLCHIAVPYRHGLEMDATWWLANVMDLFSRPAVVLFFIMSGFFSRSVGTSIPELKKLYGSRIGKSVLLPMLPALGIGLLLSGKLSEIFQTPSSIMSPLFILSTEGYHLWFLYVLIVYLLLSPFVNRMFASPTGRKFVWSGIAFWAVVVVLLCSLHLYFPDSVWAAELRPLYDMINRHLWLKNWGFFLLGAYAVPPLLDKLSLKRVLPVCILSGLAAFAIPIILNRYGIHDPFDSHRDFVRIPIAVFGVSAFFFYKYFFDAHLSIARKLASVSAWSFPIYLYHPAAIAGTLAVMPFVGSWQNLLLRIPATFIGTLAASYIHRTVFSYIGK